MDIVFNIKNTITVEILVEIDKDYMWNVDKDWQI